MSVACHHAVFTWFSLSSSLDTVLPSACSLDWESLRYSSSQIIARADLPMTTGSATVQIIESPGANTHTTAPLQFCGEKVEDVSPCQASCSNNNRRRRSSTKCETCSSKVNAPCTAA